MKNLFLICIIQFVCGAGFAQTQDSTGKVVIVEAVHSRLEKAMFPGGREALSTFLSENIKYPKKARKRKVEGRCLVSFTVTSFGNITNIKLSRGISNCPECGHEAIRVIKSMPQWVPANLNGEKFDSVEALWIPFKR